MSFFKSSNPALKENTFTGTLMEGVYTGEEMTVKGVANKFGILLLLMFSTTLFSWNWFYSGRDTLPLLIGSIIGCFKSYHHFQKQNSSLSGAGLCLT